jgi:hypothetical protein
MREHPNEQRERGRDGQPDPRPTAGASAPRGVVVRQPEQPRGHRDQERLPRGHVTRQGPTRDAQSAKPGDTSVAGQSAVPNPDRTDRPLGHRTRHASNMTDLLSCGGVERGRPWPRDAGIEAALRTAGFQPRASRRVVHYAPWPPVAAWARRWERVADRWLPGLASVLAVRAEPRREPDGRRPGAATAREPVRGGLTRG